MENMCIIFYYIKCIVSNVFIYSIQSIRYSSVGFCGLIQPRGTPTSLLRRWLMASGSCAPLWCWMATREWSRIALQMRFMSLAGQGILCFQTFRHMNRSSNLCVTMVHPPAMWSTKCVFPNPTAWLFFEVLHVDGLSMRIQRKMPTELSRNTMTNSTLVVTSWKMMKGLVIQTWTDMVWLKIDYLNEILYTTSLTITCFKDNVSIYII